MNFIRALNASASGMTAQRTRMDLISENLSNVHTTRTPEGGPFRRKIAVLAAQPFSESFSAALRNQIGSRLSEVKVVKIVEDTRPPVTKYDPRHPDADEKGFVHMPHINIIEEMVNMLTASRSYEANVTAIDITKKMVMKALDIGR
jgi:flagellar basal-body rod protein FlgC